MLMKFFRLAARGLLMLCLPFFFAASLPAGAALAASPAFFLSGHAAAPLTLNEPLLQMPLTSGSVRVGCPTGYPPYSFLDEEGRLKGIYPDIIASLNTRLNGLLLAVPVSGDYPSRNTLAYWDVDVYMGLASHLPANARLSLALFRSRTVYLGPPGQGARSLRQISLPTVALPHTPDLAAVKSQFPDMSFTYRRSLAQAAHEVRVGEAGLIIGDELSIHAEEAGIPEGLAVLGSLGSHCHALGVRPNLENVLTLLDNALHMLPPQEIRQIVKSWSGEPNSSIPSDGERHWLAESPVVRVAVFNRAPFAGISDAQRFVGMAADYVRLLSDSLGLDFVFLSMPGETEAREALRRGEADMTVLPLGDGKDGLLYTRAWQSAPVAIAAPEGSGLARLRDLERKTVAILDGGQVERWLTARSPGVKLLPVADSQAALKAVSKGRAQAAVASLDSLSHYIRHDRLSGLSITGFTPFSLEMSFAVRPELPLLASLLDKGLNAIPEDKAQEIHQHWTRAVEVRFMDWGRFWRWTGGALLCMLLVIWIFAHVNRKLRAEIRQRQKAEDTLKLIFSQMPAALAMCDPQLRCLIANQAVNGPFGLNRESLEGQTLVQAAEKAGLNEGLQQELRRMESMAAAAFRQRRSLTTRHVNAGGGKATHFRTWFVPLFDSHNRPDSLIVLSADISPTLRLAKKLRLALRKADKASQVKSDFLTHMSHELRTPMNGILGLSELLLREEPTPRQRDFLEKIRFSARILVRLIGNILDITKLEEDVLGMSQAAFDLREVLDCVRAVLAASLCAKNLDFRCRLEEGTPQRLIGDRARLTQVLLSLVGNAVKFTVRGGVEIRVSPVKWQGRDIRLRFEIQDSGIGMSEETAASVFSPFFQGDAGMARRYGGAGLGLTIAQRLVRAMHGDIGCKSAPGKGSIFYFTALFGLADAEDNGGDTPAQAPAPIPLSTPTRTVPAAQPQLRGRNILLVEDNAVNQLVARELLAALGAEVDTADDGVQAVEMALRNDYDCILMDIQMPRMDGLEATRRIKEHPSRAGTPIIALTAHAQAADREKSLKAGMVEHIAKPLDPAELHAVLARVLNGAA